jgi:hypothetical protein
MTMEKRSSTPRKIIEGLFIGAVIATNVEVLLRGIAADPTVQVPPWANALMILADVFTSYWWARLWIWLARQVWRAVRKLWPRRPRAKHWDT